MPTDYAKRKARAEQEVVNQVREHGGFSIFWLTRSQTRMRAATNLEKRGMIQPIKDIDAFPWIPYRLAIP